MAIIKVENLTFEYPLASGKALNNVSFDVNESEFCVICGKSGCGKSTLLRHLKKNLTPYGTRDGVVLYDGENLFTLDDRRSASEIGFVQQNPDNQLVTDKVWHELAFGLESLGLDNSSIRRRVAEMASFFDIQTWFRKDVSELSGGQKQLLNLASIMIMQPKVLILDEPTSQLDPIAASEFLKIIYKINRDLGTTVIISEHRLEELFPMADRVLVMEDGQIIANDGPWAIGEILANNGNEHPMFYGLSTVMKIYSRARRFGAREYLRDGAEYAPLTIRDGRLWLEAILDKNLFREGLPELVNNNKAIEASSVLNETKCDLSEDKASDNEKDKANDKVSSKENDKIKPVIEMKNIYFSYSKTSGDILRGLNLEIRKGELFCLLGGNGVGKTTTLKLLGGIIKPKEGSIKLNGRTAMLPQNPQALFTEITVEEELLEALYYCKLNDIDKVAEVNRMLEMMEISHLAKSHPYDLSGGEQQRLALGKVLLLKPDILLLDEPTKGLDPFFKITLSNIFQKLRDEGVTIFMVSHDIEFCAEYGDRCAMFFDGEIASHGRPGEFFRGNSFYTTAANRMARKWFPDAITWEEVAAWVEQVTMKEQ